MHTELKIWRNCLAEGAPLQTVTGQLADKPTRSQSSRGLDNLRTGQLADSEFLKIMELLVLYLHINPNPNSNPIEYCSV